MDDFELTGVPKKGKNFSKNNTGKRRGADFYETPYSMTRQLLEKESFNAYGMPVLEPSQGAGAITSVLKEAGLEVIGRDLSSGDDFLLTGGSWMAIVTNPPYSLATEFIIKAKMICNWKIAFLLPLSYLHGKNRFDRIFQDRDFPLAQVWTFVRAPMLGEPIRADGKYHTGMQPYAWFVWVKTHEGPPILDWIDNQEFVLKSSDK